jgi:hypothetical protein
MSSGMQNSVIGVLAPDVLKHQRAFVLLSCDLEKFDATIQKL